MNGFEEVIKKKSDEELIEIIFQSNDYQPDFIELVKRELKEIRNIDSIKDFFDGKSNEELIEILETRKFNFEFLELVNKELNERNLTHENVELVQKIRKKRIINKEDKIHGWLTFFLITIGIGGLLSPIIGFSKMSIADYDVGLGLFWSNIGMVCDGILLLGYTVLAVYIIISFLTYKPNAVLLGKAYLIIVFIFNLLFLIGGDYESNFFYSLDDKFRSLPRFAIIICLLDLFIGFVVIIDFLKFEPNAVLGKASLIVVFIFASLIVVFTFNLIILIGGDYESSGDYSLAKTIRSLIWGVIWFMYLTHSEQVKKLFPKKQRTIYTRDKILLLAIVGPIFIWLLSSFALGTALGFKEGINSTIKEMLFEEQTLSENKYVDGLIIFECPDGLIEGKLHTGGTGGSDISTGVYSYPKREEAKIAFKSSKRLSPKTSEIKKVIFCCFDEDNYQIMNQLT